MNAAPPLKSPLRLKLTDRRLRCGGNKGLRLGEDQWELQSTPGRFLPLELPATVKEGEAEKFAAVSFNEATAVAVDADGRVLVADRVACHEPYRFYRHWPRPAQAGEVPKFGYRDFLPEVDGVCREVGSMALARDGRLAVMDDQRVRVFAPGTGTLLREWVNVEGGRRAAAISFGWCGTLFVLDAGRREVRRFARFHEMLPPLEFSALAAVTAVAVSRDGLVAVTGSTGDGKGAVMICSPNGAACGPVLVEGKLLSAVFDGEGCLFAGGESGRVHVFTPKPERHCEYEWSGSGPSCGAPVTALAWHQNGYFVALIAPAERTAEVRLVSAHSGRIASGYLITKWLDSELAGTVWNRIVVDAEVPDGTSIQIESATTNDDEVKEEECAKKTDGEEVKEAPWVQCLRAGYDAPDTLVQSPPGRFLRLRITLHSDGAVSPIVRGVTLTWPRETIARHLPAVFVEDRAHRAFLENFLSIFQAGFDDFDDDVDRLWEYFDPGVVRKEHLDVLAAWMGVEIPAEWADRPAEERTARVRQLVRDAAADYPKRGTVAGIEKAVRDRAGLPFARVVEHWKLANWRRLAPDADPLGSRTTPLWSPAYLQRLQLGVNARLDEAQLCDALDPALDPFEWGAHRFTLFFPAKPREVVTTRKLVHAAVEAQRPAHTAAVLQPVFARFRVGVQATLGIDSIVGGIEPMVLSSRDAPGGCCLGYDTFLGRSPAEAAAGALGSTLSPRIGESTRLL